MIVAYKFGAWRVSFLRDCEAAKKLFEAFVDSRLPRESVTLLADGLTGKVWKIEFCGRTYVLKHDLRKRHRFEFLVQSFFAGAMRPAFCGNWTVQRTANPVSIPQFVFFWLPTKSGIVAFWKASC